MRGVYVERNVSGPNQWTETLYVEKAATVAVSVVPVGFAGTVVIQRSVDGVNFWDVHSWTDAGAQGSYDADVPQLLRIGVPVGQFSLGSVYVRLEQ